jgi:hypothetical protein
MVRDEAYVDFNAPYPVCRKAHDEAERPLEQHREMLLIH